MKRVSVFIANDPPKLNWQQKQDIRHLQYKSQLDIARIAVNGKCLKCKNFCSCHQACKKDLADEVQCDHISSLYTIVNFEPVFEEATE